MHPNAQLVMQGFTAFAAGDMATMKGLFADDAKWHFAGDNRFSGTHQGPDAIVRLMQDVQSEATIDNQPHDILASDDHVVVLIKSTATRGDNTLENDTVFVFHVAAGKVTEAWGIPRDQAANDAFWAD